ncbi:hypothetical protein [Sandaracinus amylolyticus]|uniref:hypothetical protein n=1 Tax=Sandaracinus amylolyticus TaxID=927083 RepID=UPI001F1822C2|nr:hypothetical protein [Sandaracinus amylolyticus]UJR82942.1 Hypothetical protein I5071_50070 [Sandaracinus amylolyticus]
MLQVATATERVDSCLGAQGFAHGGGLAFHRRASSEVFGYAVRRVLKCHGSFELLLNVGVAAPRVSCLAEYFAGGGDWSGGAPVVYLPLVTFESERIPIYRFVDAAELDRTLARVTARLETAAIPWMDDLASYDGLTRGVREGCDGSHGDVRRSVELVILYGIRGEWELAHAQLAALERQLEDAGPAERWFGERWGGQQPALRRIQDFVATRTPPEEVERRARKLIASVARRLADLRRG